MSRFVAFLWLLLVSALPLAEAQTTLPFTGGSSQVFTIPASRIMTWQPGVTYNGGIPNRTTIYTTLSPLCPTFPTGCSGVSDKTQIQTALDNCPSGQVVFLNPGVYIISPTSGSSTAINITHSGCTLRGSGPGISQLSLGQEYLGLSPPACGSWNNHMTPCTDIFNPQGSGGFAKNGTWLFKSDYATDNVNGVINVNQFGAVQYGTSVNIVANAARGATSLQVDSTTGLTVGQLVLVDMNTDGCYVSGSPTCPVHPDVYWSPSFGPPADGVTRQYNSRLDRSLAQIVKIASITGSSNPYTVTLVDGITYDHNTSYKPQMTPYTVPSVSQVGIEELAVFGGVNGQGGILISLCDTCWVKHVDVAWSDGPVAFASTYKSELRDSFIHDSMHPYQGGGGYLTSIDNASYATLFENNIMWSGDKVNVMRGTGGGNVVAYNYMNDTYQANSPVFQESGPNAGHYTTAHYELLEGNHSHKYSADSYWGNQVYVTIFRNWFTGLRPGAHGLSTFTTGDQPGGSGCPIPYIDTGRLAVDHQAFNYYHNYVGNIVGYSGQSLINFMNSCWTVIQNTFQYEYYNSSSTPGDNLVIMWSLGYWQNYDGMGNNSFRPTEYQTVLRQGNYDYVSAAQIWYSSPIGATGAATGSAQTLQKSMYLSSAPAFFCGSTWPWIDPSTGTAYTLPAKARFDAGTPNTLAC